MRVKEVNIQIHLPTKRNSSIFLASKIKKIRIFYQVLSCKSTQGAGWSGFDFGAMIKPSDSKVLVVWQILVIDVMFQNPSA